ncbi:hypothetical protein [Actinosynnema sp. NPDC020468]|uniref:hypothetical protein n=1 Tax=Actinosynnema sp. NPDC020468 TaxID=3154488 RepID=UPI0034072DFA
MLLTAPLEVLLDRVTHRAGNPFGHSARDRARIAADTAAVEPLPRASATLVLDTRMPLAAVVDHLAAPTAGGARRADLPGSNP